MHMPVICSNSHAPSQFPPGAKSNFICCAICHASTSIADPRFALYYASSSHCQHYHPPPHPFLVVAPSPFNHAPPGPPPNVHGTKRAVICAVSYKNTKNELKGCLNDAMCMKNLLVQTFNFPESSIMMLTEEETNPKRWPTKANMIKALSWLVQGCRPGDSLVFHFSGHGSQQEDYDGDEQDGYDEILCPADSGTHGVIVDDEINALIVKPLSHGVKLHAIIDACRSGTMLDLPFLCRMDRRGNYEWEDHRPRSGVWKGTSGGEVISFSGCDDDQNSEEISDRSKITSIGAMTSSFIQAIQGGYGSTYGSMLNAMRSTIRKKTGKLGDGKLPSFISTLLPRRHFRRGITQEPQLTAGEQFDVYSKPFSL